MATDIMIYLPDVPGSLADLGEALGAGGINIEGFCAVSNGNAAEIHLLVEEPVAVYDALAAAGIEIAGDQEVALIDVEDRPGVLGDITRRFGDAGANITLAYLATRTRLVVGAENLALAVAAMET